jgi:hypothetical protein
MEVYNSNSIKYGVFKATLNRGTEAAPTVVCASAIFEAATINRAVKEILRTDEIGSPNGFVLVRDWNIGNVTVQIPKDPSVGGNPLTPKPGDWFVVTLDATIGAEKFVLGSTNQPLEREAYYKVSAPIRRDNDSALTANPTS